MLAVRASGDAVRELLPDGLEIAAENAPGLTVVSGETRAIEGFEARLAERRSGRPPPGDVPRVPLRDDGPDPRGVRARSSTRRRDRRRRSRGSPASRETGSRASRPQDSAYWVEQLRRPVLFAKGVARLLEDPARVTLEVGPGQQLTGLAKQAVPGRPAGVVTLSGCEGPVVVAPPRRAALGRRRVARLERAPRAPGERRGPAPDLSLRAQALLGGSRHDADRWPSSSSLAVNTISTRTR